MAEYGRHSLQQLINVMGVLVIIAKTWGTHLCAGGVQGVQAGGGGGGAPVGLLERNCQLRAVQEGWSGLAAQRCLMERDTRVSAEDSALH